MLIINADLDPQQISNLSTVLEIDAQITVIKTRSAIHRVLGESVLTKAASPQTDFTLEADTSEMWDETGEWQWQDDESWQEAFQVGCFRCGDPYHWADQCPKGKGKGKGTPAYKGSALGKGNGFVPKDTFSKRLRFASNNC